MIQAVSPLQNLEMALYGALPPNAAAPSYLNNYMGGINNYDTMAYQNPYAYAYDPAAYQNVNPQNVQAGYSASDMIAQNQTTVSNSDINTLSKYYEESLSPSEGFAGAALGGASFAIMNNPRLLAHPINSVIGLKDVKEMFKDVKVDGSNLNKLWKENNAVMREAYFQMHKASSRHNSKLGLFRAKYHDKGYERLKAIMERALQSGDIQQVAEANVKLKEAYKGRNGFVLRNFNKLKSAFGFKADPVNVTEVASKAVEAGKNKSFLGFLKHGGGVKGGLLFAGLELLMGVGKIQTAFSKDSETGYKQLGQTAVKGVGSAVGWAAGEALGAWGMAALGAKIGTAFGPGIGTAIGGLVGLVGGSIGCWLAGKATKALVGQDVADKVESKKLTKTPEGQAQLLNFVIQKAQAGEKIPDNVMLAAQNVASGLELQSA